MSKIYEIKIKDIKGQETSLENFKDKALLIVNVASKCGFTPQYAGLNELYKKHKEKGLVVLGFPCNQFGGQEPGSEKEIQDFCDLTFKVEFPMFAKVDVNGDQEHPLFHLLKEEAPEFWALKQ